MKQGEIYLLKSDRVGKSRPILIVSRSELSRYTPVVLPFYSQNVDAKLQKQWTVEFQAGEFGLEKRCVLMCDELTRIFKSDLYGESNIGQVDDEKMAQVFECVKWVLNWPE